MAFDCARGRPSSRITVGTCPAGFIARKAAVRLSPFRMSTSIQWKDRPSLSQVHFTFRQFPETLSPYIVIVTALPLSSNTFLTCDNFDRQPGCVIEMSPVRLPRRRETTKARSFEAHPGMPRHADPRPDGDQRPSPDRSLT